MKHFFINGNNYLRGIRIDSVKVEGGDSVYYPNHTPRGPYVPGAMPVLDSNGGSWLGKRVVQRGDGTFVFDSYWNDSVVIRTQAATGSSWTFYRDTGTRYYQATLLGRGTMTVLSAPDSVESIMITAYDTAGLVTADPLDSFTIILSKNSGFVRVFDLYTFPYHMPDSVYRPCLDFFLDRSTSYYGNVNMGGGAAPNPGITLFNLINFINPNEQQLHNWHVGDILEAYHEGLGYPFTELFFDYILDTVSSKITAGHAETYVLNGVHYTCPLGSFPCSFPCSLIVNDGAYIFYDTVYPFIDTFSVPEENLSLPNYVFYYPSDSSFCESSPAYVLIEANYSLVGEGGAPVYYKLGIGETKTYDFDDDCMTTYTDALNYVKIAGTECGALHALGTTNVTKPVVSLEVYPNPVSSVLFLSSGDVILDVVVANMLGQKTLHRHFDAKEVQIDVSELPEGVYACTILSADGSQQTVKILKQ